MQPESSPIHARPPRVVAVALLSRAHLPVSDLTETLLEHFFYVGDATNPLGLIGVQFCGADALLRSLVVAPAARSRGIGTALVAYAESYAREKGARGVYLLTTTAEAFFRGRGYEPASRDMAPLAIRSTAEFSTLCPASSAFLSKEIRDKDHF
jgi:amino-acid N-acetyltransferase